MLSDRERSQWLADHILPNESLIRSWLARYSDFEADDIIQEAYVFIIKVDKKNITNPVGYFYTICRNIVYRKYKEMDVINISSISAIQSEMLIDPVPHLEEIVDARSELRFLEEIIQKIPEKYRNVFIERKINGHTQKHCSKKLGISENIVEKRLAHSLALVAKFYSQRESQYKATPIGWIRGNKKIS
ncbi:RNA polymerase sigma factor [Gluconobacter japonicus]|uniref:RNA polymerase sigma factor n=1 Tax=Gluconobacter japonicus TaxID=376620 RepID=UPI001B8AA312|nr:sigma-70 family RNA polymerase sigma factor [Gluconobacter japonicus]MBS1050090.1 sigma-70 family RNA polymerase sigma factor [Gluconobacter japonicus]